MNATRADGLLYRCHLSGPLLFNTVPGPETSAANPRGRRFVTGYSETIYSRPVMQVRIRSPRARRGRPKASATDWTLPLFSTQASDFTFGRFRLHQRH